METVMNQLMDKTEAVRNIKNKIVVFSGKGGVGKTTISINLSYALAMSGYKVGLLDADITGPNVPKLLDVKEEISVGENGKILPAERSGVKLVSMGLMIREGNPIIWRGPLKTKVIIQFLSDVNWGDIDTLVVDLPPGTGDEILTILQFLKPNIAVVVTTPQGVSVADASRAVSMAKKFSIPFIGVIENMSGLKCPKCGYEINIFGKGGGKRMAEEMKVEFLGFCPFDINMKEGEIAVIKNDSEFSKSIFEMVKKIKSQMR